MSVTLTAAACRARSWSSSTRGIRRFRSSDTVGVLTPSSLAISCSVYPRSRRPRTFGRRSLISLSVAMEFQEFQKFRVNHVGRRGGMLVVGIGRPWRVHAWSGAMRSSGTSYGHRYTGVRLEAVALRIECISIGCAWMSFLPPRVGRPLWYVRAIPPVSCSRTTPLPSSLPQSRRASTTGTLH